MAWRMGVLLCLNVYSTLASFHLITESKVFSFDTLGNALLCHKLREGVKQTVSKYHTDPNVCFEDIYENYMSQSLKWIVDVVHYSSTPDDELDELLLVGGLKY